MAKNIIRSQDQLALKQGEEGYQKGEQEWYQGTRRQQ
jgi:hypothetical protein